MLKNSTEICVCEMATATTGSRAMVKPKAVRLSCWLWAVMASINMMKILLITLRLSRSP